MAPVKRVREFWKAVCLCGVLAVADDLGNWVLQMLQPFCASCLSYSPLKPGDHLTLSSSVVSVKTKVCVAMEWVLHAFLGGAFLWPL